MSKCAHVDYRYVQNSFIQKLNKKTKYRNSVEGMYFLAQKLYIANTTMHFISKQILHVHVIASNCSFSSFLTLKLRVYIHMSR